MSNEKLPNWVIPVVAGGAVITTVGIIGAYFLTRPKETVYESTSKREVYDDESAVIPPYTEPVAPPYIPPEAPPYIPPVITQPPPPPPPPALPEGALVKSPDNATVYAIKGGYKCPIAAGALEARGYRWSNLKVVSAAIVE